MTSRTPSARPPTALWLHLLAALMLLLGAARAHALGADAWNSGFIIDFNEQWLRQDAYNRAISQARKDLQPRRTPRGDPDFRTDILFTGTHTVVNGEFIDDSSVRKLAQMFPPAQRKAGAAMFTQVIAGFNDNVERLYGVPRDNLATGIVALLAGGYAAYHQKPFPERAVKPAVAQIGDWLRRRPELFEGQTSQKRDSYQTAVGVGMLLQAAQAELARKPDAAEAARLKAAGAQVLRGVLGAEPDRIEFSAAGIGFR